MELERNLSMRASFPLRPGSASASAADTADLLVWRGVSIVSARQARRTHSSHSSSRGSSPTKTGSYTPVSPRRARHTPCAPLGPELGPRKVQEVLHADEVHKRCAAASVTHTHTLAHAPYPTLHPFVKSLRGGEHFHHARGSTHILKYKKSIFRGHTSLINSIRWRSLICPASARTHAPRASRCAPCSGYS